MARARTAAWIGLAGLWFACTASPPPARLEPGHEGAPGISRFLLAPANLAIALRPELEAGVEPVQEEIAGYLKLHGREVERLSLIEGRPMWDQAAAESGTGFGAAATAFAHRLAAGREFDAVVMPSLVLHYVRIKHRTSSWDGVKRRMPLVNVPHRSSGRGSNILVDSMVGGGIGGDTAVTSLHIVVLSRDGQRVFEGRGGLEFLNELDLVDIEKNYRVYPRVRGDLLQDRAILREGIEIAFRPYLVPPEGT